VRPGGRCPRHGPGTRQSEVTFRRADRGSDRRPDQDAPGGRIQQVESLRRDVKEFRSRIGKQSDSNEWVQYILDGSRKIGVQLRGMEIKEPRKIGPYMAVSLQMEVQGTYPQLQSFIEWLDQSDRLLRVESLRLEKTPNVILMKIYVLGLVQKNA
jgi:Tfp pilus assembly protein PilO